MPRCHLLPLRLSVSPSIRRPSGVSVYTVACFNDIWAGLKLSTFTSCLWHLALPFPAPFIHANVSSCPTVMCYSTECSGYQLLGRPGWVTQVPEDDVEESDQWNCSHLDFGQTTLNQCLVRMINVLMGWIINLRRISEYLIVIVHLSLWYSIGL